MVMKYNPVSCNRVRKPTALVGRFMVCVTDKADIATKSSNNRLVLSPKFRDDRRVFAMLINQARKVMMPINLTIVKTEPKAPMVSKGKRAAIK